MGCSLCSAIFAVCFSDCQAQPGQLSESTPPDSWPCCAHACACRMIAGCLHAGSTAQKDGQTGVSGADSAAATAQAAEAGRDGAARSQQQPRAAVKGTTSQQQERPSGEKGSTAAAEAAEGAVQVDIPETDSDDMDIDIVSTSSAERGIARSQVSSVSAAPPSRSGQAPGHSAAPEVSVVNAPRLETSVLAAPVQPEKRKQSHAPQDSTPVQPSPGAAKPGPAASSAQQASAKAAAGASSQGASQASAVPAPATGGAGAPAGTQAPFSAEQTAAGQINKAPAVAPSKSGPVLPQAETSSAVQPSKPASALTPASTTLAPKAVQAPVQASPASEAQKAVSHAPSKAALAAMQSAAAVSGKPTGQPERIHQQAGTPSKDTVDMPASSSGKAASEAPPSSTIFADPPAVSPPAKPAPKPGQQRDSGSGLVPKAVQAPLKLAAPAIHQKQLLKALPKPTLAAQHNSADAPAQKAVQPPATNRDPRQQSKPAAEASRQPVLAPTKVEAPAKQPAASATQSGAPAQASTHTPIPVPIPKPTSGLPAVQAGKYSFLYPQKEGSAPAKPQKVSRFAPVSQPAPAVTKMQTSRPASGPTSGQVGSRLLASNQEY